MLNGVDHIGIAVYSIEESLPFYQALGLTVGHIEEVEVDQVRVAFIDCGNTHIELLEPLSESSHVARFLEKRGPGIHHICLTTPDIKSTDQTLREAGIQMTRPQPTRGAGGCWVQFVHPKSAGGILFELSQPREEAAPGSVPEATETTPNPALAL
jgi:methylmalonyl-CoA/ethylmalonyl-CoA epimerase